MLAMQAAALMAEQDKRSITIFGASGAALAHSLGIDLARHDLVAVPAGQGTGAATARSTDAPAGTRAVCVQIQQMPGSTWSNFRQGSS